MKILQLTQHYLPFHGGVEMHIYEISRRLVKDGFDVEVICGREAGSAKYEVMDGVKVHRVASFSLAKLRYDIGRIDVGNAYQILLHSWAKTLLSRHEVCTALSSKRRTY